MKKYFFFFLTVLFFFYSSIKAQSPDTNTSSKNSLQKKSWSLQFSVGSNFSVQSFDGLMFSLKYHLSDKFALRFGVGGWGNLSNGNDEENHVSFPNTYNNQNVIAVCSFLLYPSPKALISIFLGIGPRFSYSHYYENYVHYSSNSYPETDESTTWQAGLQGSFGAEWFPVKIISLFAEYTAYATYGKTHEDYERYDEFGYPISQKHDSEDWKFNGNTARLGLSVYF